jgi:hypothetical protein
MAQPRAGVIAVLAHRGGSQAERLAELIAGMVGVITAVLDRLCGQPDNRRCC